MEALSIEATKDSPCVRFDPVTREFEISGESYPENAAKFYAPVFEWIERYLAEPGVSLTLRLKLTYINSSSSKIILNLLDMLDAAAEQGVAVTVQWIYQEGNFTLQECGEEFAEDIANLEFNFVEIAQA